MTLTGSGPEVTGVTLTLANINLHTTGLYGCEASAEPSFHTELVRKHLTVMGEFISANRQMGWMIRESGRVTPFALFAQRFRPVHTLE